MKKNSKLSVARDGDGLPTSFRIFAPGELEYTLPDTTTKRAVISEADIQAMADWHAGKGVRLPIDCEHYIHYLSRLSGVTEAEFKAQLPTARGVLGDCVVALHDGELWADDVRFNDAAKPFLKAGVLKYFSPVIYGLDTPSAGKKLTSIALTANPAINHSEPLVASDGSIGIRLNPIVLSDCSDSENNNPKQRKEAPKMNKILEFLKEWLGMECPADMDDTKAEEVIAAIKAKHEAVKTEGATALSDTHKEIETLRSEVRALSDKNAKSELDAMVRAGMSEGKITAALEPWARAQTPAVLSDFLKNAPSVVPSGRLNAPAAAAASAPVVLSDAQSEIAKACGLTDEEFKAQMKG